MKRVPIKLVLIFPCLLIIKFTMAQITYVDLNIDQPNVENCITGIETNFQSENMNVFPNPTGGLFTINMDKVDFTGELLIFIHDINGKSIYTEKINVTNIKFEKQVDISGHPAGIYLLNMVAQEKYYRAEIIIK